MQASLLFYFYKVYQKMTVLFDLDNAWQAVFWCVLIVIVHFNIGNELLGL